MPFFQNLPIPFNLIPIQIPPIFETALGYTGKQPFVAFWWQPAGDELCYCDGSTCLYGANHLIWIKFITHPLINYLLKSYNLGSSSGNATHRLLVDGINRKIYVGSISNIDCFLKLQCTTPSQSPIDYSYNEINKSIEDVLSIPFEKALQDLKQRVKNECLLFQEFSEWLNALSI